MMLEFEMTYIKSELEFIKVLVDRVSFEIFIILDTRQPSSYSQGSVSFVLFPFLSTKSQLLIYMKNWVQ